MTIDIVQRRFGRQSAPPSSPVHMSTAADANHRSHHRLDSFLNNSLRRSISNNSRSTYSTLSMRHLYRDSEHGRNSPPSIVVNGIDNTGARPDAPRRRRSMQALYPALLSVVALELLQQCASQNSSETGIEPRPCNGREIVDKLMNIARIQDRRLALRLGRALEYQRLFHDVVYERRLIDSDAESYCFHEQFISALCLNAQSSGTLTVSGSDSPSDHDSSSSLHVSHSRQNYDPYVTFASLRRQDIDLFPNGVFTEFTRCYTPLCAVTQFPCYSPSCPKKQKQLRERQESEDSGIAIYPTSTRSSENEYIRPRRLWMDTVSGEVLESVSKEERKRQEAIFEVIQTEDYFVRDMEYIHERWIIPIKNSSIIPDERTRDAFIRAAFANITEVHGPHAELAEALHKRQQKQPIVAHIGDILLQFVDRFEPLIKYSANQWDSRYAMERERSVNPSFENFVKTTEAHPSSLRMPINGYLSRPITRTGQYSLLLEKVLKHTPEDNPDTTAIPLFIERITDLMNRMNAETGRRKNRFDLRCIHQNLMFRDSRDAVDLRLLDQEREIKLQDTLRKSSSLESAGYEMILFDHFLIVTEVRVENADKYYTVQRAPIPIDLLVLSETEPGRTRRANSILPYIPGGHAASTGAHMPLRTSMDSTTFTSAPAAAAAAASTAANASSKNGIPIVFRHLGRKHGEYFTLYTPSLATRRPWFETVRDLQEERTRRFSIFYTSPAISRQEFYIDCKINHMSTFNNGRQYILSTDHGIYVGHTRVSSRPRRVLAIERVTQAQALEHAQKLLVLTDRVLWEYPLHVVNGNPRDRPQHRKVLTKVPLFHVAPCIGRTLVCVPRITALKTTINVFEATGLEEYNKRHRGEQGADIPAPLDLPLKRFKQCSVPSEVWDIELTHTKMFLTTARGVEMVDMKDTRINTSSRRLLNIEDPRLNFITNREKEAMNIKNQQKHIALFRTPQGEHLLCYDEFAFFIDGQGNLARSDFRIEWEGSPEAFAFIYPYVLAFEPTFIEVRNIQTGQREQIIRGTDIKCLTHHSTYKSPLPFVFGVMTDPENDCYQYIFRLERVARKDAYSV